jgi:uncharacterized protein YcbK (DUF882 family)
VITLGQYWMGRDEVYPHNLTPEIRDNATELLRRVNDLLAVFGEERGVRSGWRPPQVNASTPNAAPFSKHMTGQALDLDDPHGDMDQWALDNTNELARLGLWLEHPSATKGWCHLQSQPPKSGKRVFYP